MEVIWSANSIKDQRGCSRDPPRVIPDSWFINAVDGKLTHSGQNSPGDGGWLIQYMLRLIDACCKLVVGHLLSWNRCNVNDITFFYSSLALALISTRNIYTGRIMGLSDYTASKLAVHKDKLLTASLVGIVVVLLGANWIEYRFLKVTYNRCYITNLLKH